MLFKKLPIIVGRVATWPRQLLPHDAAGLPLLFTRDGSGKVHAMLNR